jgi:hypothetical protein
LAFRIASFDPALHERAGFCSGAASIDNFLILTAKKQQNADMIRVRVLTSEESNRVLGFMRSTRTAWKLAIFPMK